MTVESVASARSDTPAPKWADTSARRIARALVPVVIALIFGAIVLVASGKNPLGVYWLFLKAAVGSTTNIAGTLSAATPLLLTGLGCAICFRAGYFNVGLEGCVYVGALATAWVAFIGNSIPGPLLIALALLGGATAGLAWMVLPALLRSHLNINEVVTTLMLNYVAIGLTSYLVLYHFLYSTTGNAQSPPIAKQAVLQPLVSGTTLTVGFFVALAAVIGYGWMLRNSRLGFHIRTVGDSPRFAAAIGISLRKMALTTILISGALGGLAGAFVVLGVTQNFTNGFSTAPGYGYTGIAVAVLARNSWGGVILGSLFFGGLESGG
ncbi:MAG: ABC transporter permease, partial [Streptosporangiaceae bacterium]